MVPIIAVVGIINDAISVISALTPLVQQALASGTTTVTTADVEAARRRLQLSIDQLDAEIAAARGAKP